MPFNNKAYFQVLLFSFCFYADFANICALRLLTGCELQVRNTKVTSLQYSIQYNSNYRSCPILSTNSKSLIFLGFCRLWSKCFFINRSATIITYLFQYQSILFSQKLKKLLHPTVLYNPFIVQYNVHTVNFLIFLWVLLFV